MFVNVRFSTYFRIVSKNNARHYNGKTSYGFDPHVQRVNLPGQERDCLAYQVTFNDNDFEADGPVYKHLDQIEGKQRLFLFRFTSLTFVAFF